MKLKNSTAKGIVLGLVLLASAVFCHAADEANDLPILIDADGGVSTENGLATASGNVVIHHGADLVYADKVSYDPKKKEVLAEGNVKIYTQDRIIRGDKVLYNFETKAVVATTYRAEGGKLLVGGMDVASPETNHYRVKEGYFTTDNRQNPAWRMQANTVEIYPDDQIVLKNVVVYADNVPILWLPFYVQSLKDDRTNLQLEFGANSAFGPFVLGTYNWYDNDNIRGAVHLDWREKRGLAGGVDLQLRPNADSTMLLRGYYAKDNDPNYNPTDLPRGGVNDDRYRVGLLSRTALGYDMSVIANFDVLSDPYMERDFYPSEFALNPMPDNFVDITQYNPNFTASVLVRQQLNPWYETVERSPDVELESRRQRIFGLPISYQSNTGVANLSRQFPSTNPVGGEFPSALDGLNSSNVYRYNTYQEIEYAHQYFNWLSVTPRLGLDGAYYYHEYSDVPGPHTYSDDARLLPVVGLESSFKISKIVSNMQDSALGIDGLRHMAEPFFDAQYIPFSEAPSALGFDTLVPNTRLQAINFPDFNSADSVNKQFIVRHGIRNKLQTKRDGANWDLINWAIYADADFDREFNSHLYSNVVNEISIKPFTWLSLDSYESTPLYQGGYSVYDNGIKWQANKALELGFGNRQLTNAPVDPNTGSRLYPDSNLFYLSAFYRLNENWQFETQHQFESDNGQLQTQLYRVYRDLSAWQLALTLQQNNNQGGQNEELVYFTLTLKSFPKQEISINTK